MEKIHTADVGSGIYNMDYPASNPSKLYLALYSIIQCLVDHIEIVYLYLLRQFSCRSVIYALN